MNTRGPGGRNVSTSSIGICVSTVNILQPRNIISHAEGLLSLWVESDAVCYLDTKNGDKSPCRDISRKPFGVSSRFHVPRVPVHLRPEYLTR